MAQRVIAANTAATTTRPQEVQSESHYVCFRFARLTSFKTCRRVPWAARRSCSLCSNEVAAVSLNLCGKDLRFFVRDNCRNNSMARRVSDELLRFDKQVEPHSSVDEHGDIPTSGHKPIFNFHSGLLREMSRTICFSRFSFANSCTRDSLPP